MIVYLLSLKIYDKQGETNNVFGLSDSDCKKRYVEYYDMCDVYKNEKIPDNEVFFFYLLSTIRT